MINSKKITLGDKDVVVSEVKVKRLLQLLPFYSAGQKPDSEEELEPAFMENLEELLFDSCGMTVSELEELHGSELEKLWQAFREVNGFFFKMSASLGIEAKLAELLNTLLSAFGGTFANYLSEAMTAASTTDSPGS